MSISRYTKNEYNIKDGYTYEEALWKKGKVDDALLGKDSCWKPATIEPNRYGSGYVVVAKTKDEIF